MDSIRLGLYRHFKGIICDVIGVAKHSETQEELAVYRHDGQIWVRPLAMFNETVKRDGKTMPRFTYLGKLVRDRIPEIIAKEGRAPDTWVAAGMEYRDFVAAKLAEEVDEFRAKPNAEELADILEVAAAAADAFAINHEALERAGEEKRQKRGGFTQRFILRS